eukprot:9097007-Karenia_brevis.AAC.1
MAAHDTPSPAKLATYDVDDDTPEKPEQHQAGHAADDADQDSSEGINQGFGPHVNNRAVPLVDEDFNPIAKCTDDAFFLVGPWIYKALKLKTPKGETSLARQIRAGIAAQCGKHKRRQWKVDKLGNPLASVLNVPLHGVDLTVIASGHKLGVKYTEQHLTHVLKCARQGDKDNVDTCAAVDDHDSVASVDHAVDMGVATALSNDHLQKLKQHSVKWHPSKRVYMYGKSHTKKKLVKVPRKTRLLYRDRPAALVSKVKRYTVKVGNKICMKLREGDSDAWVSDTSMTLSSDSSADS